MVIATDSKSIGSKPANKPTASKHGDFRTAQMLDKRLGDLLINNGTLTEHEIKKVLEAERQHGERFSDVALRLGLVTELDMRRALARQCEVSATLPDAATFSPQLTVAHYPNSARAEALRGLRSELLLRWFNNGHSVLAIGEARPQQGGAQLAANLAWSLAQLGQRTLLIDADLRHPQLQTLFKLRSQSGLSEFLNGDCNVEDVLNSVPAFNQLSVMFAGKPPENPQELLSIESFRYLLDAMREAFDIVIVAGPPILQYADMQAIAARAGGFVLNVPRRRTRLADLQAAKSRLVPTGATLVGLVLEH